MEMIVSVLFFLGRVGEVFVAQYCSVDIQAPKKSKKHKNCLGLEHLGDGCIHVFLCSWLFGGPAFWVSFTQSH